MHALLTAAAAFAFERSIEGSRATGSMIDGAFLASSKMLAMDGHAARIHRAMKDVALAKSATDVDKAVTAIPALERTLDEEFSAVRASGRVDISLLAQIRGRLEAWQDLRAQTIELVRARNAEEAGARARTVDSKRDLRFEQRRLGALTVVALCIGLLVGTLLARSIKVSLAAPRALPRPLASALSSVVQVFRPRPDVPSVDAADLDHG